MCEGGGARLLTYAEADCPRPRVALAVLLCRSEDVAELPQLPVRDGDRRLGRAPWDRDRAGEHHAAEPHEARVLELRCGHDLRLDFLEARRSAAGVMTRDVDTCECP